MHEPTADPYFFILQIRVAQIVAAWQRRCEKVEVERENGRKWREREGERERETTQFC